MSMQPTNQVENAYTFAIADAPNNVICGNTLTINNHEDIYTKKEIDAILGDIAATLDLINGEVV